MNSVCFMRQGSNATLNFYLNDFTDGAFLESAIRDIRFLGGQTNVSGALRLTRTEVFNAVNGDRPHVPDVIIMFLDGPPNVDAFLLPFEVAAIESRGIRFVGVAITFQVSFVSFLISSTVKELCSVYTPCPIKTFSFLT